MAELEKELENDDEPIIEHQLSERTQLEQILCDFSTDLTLQAIVARKVSAINLFVALASRQEFQTRTRKPRSVPAFKDLIKREYPAPKPSQPAIKFPVVCQKTQCIFCIGNERLPYEQRTRTFNRVSHMWDHVENVHLSKVPAEQRIICYHPVCKAQGLVLDHVMHFKNHVARVHKIDPD
ncbi:FluG domain-containing protein [Leptodontidium sp. MPI-SDFR-AT-0119]|nr:FluG domain-containing protein [Leptodontidium sp. MPI-SDFR-AT-0119]